MTDFTSRLAALIGAVLTLGVAEMSGAQVSTFAVDDPLVHPETAENVELIESLIQGAGHWANRLYGDSISVVEDAEEADIVVTLSATVTEDTPVMSLRAERLVDGVTSDSFVFFDEWTTALVPQLAQVFYYLWAELDGFSMFEPVRAPEYLAELHTSWIDAPEVAAVGGQLYPTGIAALPDGGFIVGATSLAFTVDENLMVGDVIGAELLADGVYGYAFDVGATRAGSLFFRGAAGSDLYVLRPGASRIERIRTRLSAPGPIAVLSDGSAILVDGGSLSAVRVTSRRPTPIDVFPGEYSYGIGVSPGPAGNIWVADASTRRVVIYTPDGEPVDSIVPMVPNGELMGTRDFTVYPNGDFLVLTFGGLTKFTRSGEPLWRITELPEPGIGPFGQFASVAVQPESGTILLADTAGRRVVKLYDRHAETYGAALSELDARVSEINARLAADPYDVTALKETARLYQAADSMALARGQWQLVLDTDPWDSEATRAVEALDLARLIRRARAAAFDTYEALDELGVESARPYYREAVRLYEEILARNPDDTTLHTEVERLKREFARREGVPQPRPGPLTVASFEAAQVFPTLFRQYVEEPMASIVVRNDGARAVRDLRVEVSMPYLDYPVLVENTDPIGAGNSRSIPIILPLAQDVLSLEEDLPVQIAATLTYTDGTEEFRRPVSTSTVIHRRTALRWDDTAKLAAFVTPNESVVAGFALRAARGANGGSMDLPDRLLRAARIFAAVGEHGVEYIEDPASPFSSVFETESSVDTVRFPRTTLYYRSGDCDDTTALLASLYEAAGIETAIVTSPGHVFLAFDTGEPRENRWQFSNDHFEVVSHAGRLWIPLETTITDRGFVAAWAEGSRLVRAYGGTDELEFVPIGDARGRYSALPLPATALEIVEPPVSAVDARFSDTLASLLTRLYERSVSELAAEIEATSGRRKLRPLSRLGILHARFGAVEDAEALFLAAAEEFPSSPAPHINLANLRLAAGDPSGAVAHLTAAQRIRPGYSIVTLLLAQSYHAMGESEEASRHYADLLQADPDLAERFAYLKGATGRASSANQIPPRIWAQ